MRKRKIVPEFIVLSALVIIAVTFLPTTPLMAGEQAAHSTANVYWNWDPATPIGTSEVIRSNSGITAVYNTSGLPAGQAVTLWMVFFNNPELCAIPFSCVAPAEVGTPGIDADFHFVGGHVVGAGGKLTVAGHLKVGDISGSGLGELGMGGFSLAHPFKAQVILAIHSHGPKLTGQGLKSQISSFLGGCEVFLGPDGIGAGPQDVPDQIGECSTLQFSNHQGLIP
jgi:hypothetical protein